MKSLLRAAVELREREQFISDDISLDRADVERSALLSKLAKPTCSNCGGRVNEANSVGICTGKPACVALRRRALKRNRR